MPNPNLDALVTEVSETTTVQASAVTLLNGLSAVITDIKAQLAAQGIDNQTLNDLSANLDSSTNDLAAAISANTPQEPQP